VEGGSGRRYTAAIGLPWVKDEAKLPWRRRRGWVALVLGVAALGVALASSVGRSPAPVRRITLTAGFLDTTRALVARTVVAALAPRGIEARLVDTTSADDELEHVDRGAIDFALVSGAYRIERYPNVRAVTPLYIEALHLLVKEEFAADVGRGLDALHGRTVYLGPPGSTSAGLAVAVLDFAGITPQAAGRDGYVGRSFELAELEALVARGDRAALPDALMLLATVPSKIALQLIRSARYSLVPLPFAEAFRLGVLLSDDAAEGPAASVNRRHVTDTVIPAFTYAIDPSTPAAPLHTIGARLMLVANERVPAEAVERVLDTVFAASIAQLASPPLDRSVLALPSSVEPHDGTSAYIRRDTPYVTDDTVNALSNSLSILGALAGGGLFLWQWWRQRTQARRDEIFGTYMLRVADVERRIAALELSATLQLEPLAELQRELLELKREALDRFAAGDLGDQAAISDLLTPINAARDHIGSLILHIRDNLEEQADAQGRTATALWTEAIEKPEGTDG
jgi:TRAP-type uncharacterized transport system substrate-binding protein